MAPAFAPDKKLTNVRIIDFAPTLAWLLKIPRPKDATGRVLYEAFERRSIKESRLTPQGDDPCPNPPWQPPALVSLAETLDLHRQVTALPDLPIQIRQEIFRIGALEMDWDIGVVVYEPQDAGKFAIGPDKKKVGVFLLHGGVSDFKSVERIARTLAI